MDNKLLSLVLKNSLHFLSLARAWNPLFGSILYKLDPTVLLDFECCLIMRLRHALITTASLHMAAAILILFPQP